MPTAGSITVSQVDALFNGPWADVARGVSEGQFALWVGSGISLDRVPGLEGVVKSILTALQQRSAAAGHADNPYEAAIDEILSMVWLDQADRDAIDANEPPESWPKIDVILKQLSASYSKVLDVRVEGHQDDYVLWEAADVRGLFSGIVDPDCEHLCIAILGLEGCVPEIVSANWDGLIERAVEDLTGGAASVLNVAVLASELRATRKRMRLLKFHGCAVLADSDPQTYRQALVGQASQISGWPSASQHRPMRNELKSLATLQPTLMVGLSAQDSNIRDVFAAAEDQLNWPWPTSPPALVFAEDALGTAQRELLKLVYRSSYSASGPAIEQSALVRAYGKALLTALVIYSWITKLEEISSAAGSNGGAQALVTAGLAHLRKRLAAAASPDPLAFIQEALRRYEVEGRRFQGSSFTSAAYRPLSVLPAGQTLSDTSLASSGSPEAAAAVGLFAEGERQKLWTIDQKATAIGNRGMLRVETDNRDAAIFFAATPSAAIEMERDGVWDARADDAVVIHSKEFANPLPRSPLAAPGRTGEAGARHVVVSHLLDAEDEALHRLRQEAGL